MRPLYFFAFTIIAAIAIADQPLGIAKTQPKSGSSIAIANGFMVPYAEAIPGTNITFEMIPVAGGTFLMGSPHDAPDRKPDEGPQVQVRVAPMWVGKCEVTWGEYRVFQDMHAFFAAVKRSTARTDVDAVTAPTPIYDPAEFESGLAPEQPAVAMTQFSAQQYTKWLSGLTGRQYRLPSEAEWEYACRAGSTEAYTWGDSVLPAEKHAWFNVNSARYSSVGLKQANTFGLCDMHGNVAEWTVNAYTQDGYKWLTQSQPIDAIDTILWPKQATSCVARGGMWRSGLKQLRCAARIESDDDQWKRDDPGFPQSPWWQKNKPAYSVGFRLFRSLQPLDQATMVKFWDHTATEIHEAVDFYLDVGRAQAGIVNDALPAAMKEHREYLEELRHARQQRSRQPARP